MCVCVCVCVCVCTYVFPKLKKKCALVCVSNTLATHWQHISITLATRIYILHIYVSKYTHIKYIYTHKKIYKDACIQCIYVYTHI